MDTLDEHEVDTVKDLIRLRAKPTFETPFAEITRDSRSRTLSASLSETPGSLPCPDSGEMMMT